MTNIQVSEEELFFDSSDGKHKIYTYLCRPTKMPRAVLQFAHGMAEHIGRYREMAAYFAERGIVFAGCDHIGHGKTASSPEELGFFAEEDGADTVTSDLHKLTRLLKERFSGLPVFLAGHSMGSFLVRLYAMTYGHEIDGLVLIGTGGPKAAVGLGKAIASFLGGVRGSHHRSPFVKKLASSGYLKRCGKHADPAAWISSDPKEIDAYNSDPLSGFLFTVRAYYDLFDMVERTNRKGAEAHYRKDLPILLLSGEDDPVGDFGRGPTTVCQRLVSAGFDDVTLKLYKEARHELHHETCRHRFFSELFEWIDAHIPADSAGNPRSV